MRYGAGPTSHAQVESLIPATIKSHALRGDRLAEFFVSQVDSFSVKRAAKNPCLSVRGSTTCENEVIEQNPAGAKSLIVREQTTESLELRCILRIKAGHRRQRKHLDFLKRPA